MHAARDHRRATLAATLVVAAITALFLFRVPLLLRRNYDPDELQHLHGAYSVSEGLVPYVDYFEHHPPLTAWLLAPVVELGGARWSTVQAARGVMLPFAAGILVLTFLVGRRALGATVAGVGVLLLSATVIFVDKSLEIRPDVPATFLWLAGLHTLSSAVRTERGRGFVLAGAWFGLALMFTPKLVFGVVGASLGVLAARRGAVVRGLALAVAGSLLPLAATLAALATEGAAGAFVHHVVLGPLDWPRELSAWRFTEELVRSSAAVALLGALGALGWWLPRQSGAGAPAGAASPPFTPNGADADGTTRLALAGAATLIAVGWWIVPVPWPQFLLPLLPLLALGAADVLVRGAALLHGDGRRRRLELALAALAVAGALALAAFGERTFHPHRATFAALFGLVALPVAVAPARTRLLHAALLAALAVPLARVVSRDLWRDTELRREFALVMAETAPTDTVLTGWFGASVFRPHAYRYFFLHDGVLASLTAEQRGADVLALLRERPPRAVIRDDATRKLSPEVNAYLDAHYTHTGVGPIWLRNTSR